MNQSIRYLFLIISTSIACCAPSLQPLWPQITSRITQNINGNHISKDNHLTLCACNALNQHGIDYPEMDAELLQTLDSIHLFTHIVPKITQTNLLLGRLVFTKNLTQITDNFEKLEQRQKLITHLEQNPTLVRDLNSLLTQLQTSEQILLSFFYPEQTVQITETSSLVQAYNTLKHKIEHNQFVAEFLQRSSQFALLSAYVAIIYSIKNIQSFHQAPNNTLKNIAPTNTNDSYLHKTCQSMFKSSTTAQTAVNIVFVGIQTINLTLFTKRSFDTFYQKQSMLCALAHAIETIKKIEQLIKAHPDVAVLIPEYARIEQVATYEQQPDDLISYHMKKFLNLLTSSSFQEGPNYLFSRQGKIIETFTRFLDVKHELIPIFEALGNLDAQLCTIKLLQRTDAHFCKPTWIQATKPIINIVGYWHPLLNPLNAITNSIELGAHHPNNVIITGSNAGGKTTALVAIAFSHIMAQSIGIAPAEQLQSTPFAKFHTYLDIATNLANNESLFVAQAHRITRLQNSIMSCSKNQKTLSILDEILTGTRADFASQASFDLACELGAIPHSICLIATHFPKLTQLTAAQNFCNYKTADATICSNGQIIYPYKIIPGISDQNIANHILQQCKRLQQ